MPPSRIDLTDFKGLVTAPGQLERAVASCVQCTNWEFPAPGLIRKRRGSQRLDGNVGAPVWKLLTSRLMGDNVLAHVGTASDARSFRYGDGSATFGTIGAIDGGNLTRNDPKVRTQMAVCQRNHYVTVNEGVARIESDIGVSPARFAGMPRGIGRISTIVQTGTALADGFARAYRMTFHRVDADGVELGGAPTGRWVVANRSYTSGYTGATRAAVFSMALPREWGTTSTAITTSYYYRIWGTKTYDEANGQLGDDEMFLLTERFIIAADLAGDAIVSFIDDTPDAFLQGAPVLHTNLYNFPDADAGLRQGVANEDAPPPPANDVAYWQDCMWYADLAPREFLQVALIAPLANNDTVTVFSQGSSVTFTGKTGALGAATDFSIVTTGPTTGINIRETVANLCAVINRATGVADLGANAFHVSTTGTQPGVIFIEARRAGEGVGFTSSVSTKWQGFDGFAITSNATTPAQPNGLAWSKPLRADAVPPVNRLQVGPVDSRVLRIFPYRDRLLVFTDYGIYQVTGRTFADFGVYPFDLGYRLMGRDNVALCDERVYAWCYEGIIEIDDGGVRVISAPIEPTIEQAMVTAGTNTGGGTDYLDIGRNAFEQLCFAVAYRNQHQVRFHYPQTSFNAASIAGCAYWLSWDTRTRTWAQGQFPTKTFGGWFDSRNAGVVRFTDDLMAHGSWSTGADTYLFLERREYAASDYTDDTRDGVTDTIISTLYLQFMVPDIGGAQHWQQTVWSWDESGFSWVTRPTNVNFQFRDEAGIDLGLVLYPASPQTRVEVPVNRRAQRLRVGLIHAQGEYAGVTGVVQHYRSGTKFGRRTESGP